MGGDGVMAKLGELGKIITGNTPKTSDAQNYESNDICFVKPSDFTDNEITEIHQSEFYISAYAKDKARVLPTDSILVTCIGIIGKVAINKVPCAFNQQINAIVPEKKVCNPRYIAYAIQNLQPKMQSTANAAVVPILNKTQFSNLEVPLLPVGEQKQIACNLNKIDKLIFLRKQQLAKLDELINARFMEMFGNPSNNSLGFPYEPLSNCLLSIENGKSFVCSNDMRQEENPAILKLSAVTYGVYQQDENKAILDSSMFVKSAEVHKGDLLFTRKNTPELVGMCAYVNDTAPNLMMPDLIFRLNTNEKINKIFLWKLINHEFFRGKIQNIATGSAKSMSNISKERLEKLAIILPPLHLQNDFAALVERVDQQKQTIQQSLEKLELLKKALMQEYFG